MRERGEISSPERARELRRIRLGSTIVEMVEVIENTLLQPPNASGPNLTWRIEFSSGIPIEALDEVARHYRKAGWVTGTSIGDEHHTLMLTEVLK